MSELRLAAAAATEAAGAGLAQTIRGTGPEPLCIYLSGELGAGKTTFARGFLRGLGYQGRVPSPTYTLVEPYVLAEAEAGSGASSVWHLDLYRLGDPGELEYLGIAEMTEPGSVLLVEWPERGIGFIPASDIEVILKVISNERSMQMSAGSRAGQTVLQRLHKASPGASM